MKTFFLPLSFFLVAVLHFGLSAQNLVPNPSFEDTVSCPYDLTLIDYAQGWSSYRITPDYFNACCQNPMAGVPRNEWGYQFPASGNAYIGIETWAAGFGPNLMEIAGCQLSTPLVIGTKYYLSMKVCRTEKNIIATNNIGISFSTVPYNQTDTVPINNTSAIKASSIITDTTNWVLVKGTFVADSAYDYVMVGNFYDDQHTDTVSIPTDTTNLGWLLFEAIYYVDDVCVSLDSSTCFDWNVVETFSNSDFNIYPNPASNKIYFNNNTQNEFDCSLINMLGELVGTYPSISANSIDVSTIPEGIYLLQLKFRNQLIQKKQIILH